MGKKGLAILVLSASLCMGAGAVSTWAASGWVSENGSWVYYGSDGSLVTYEWRKGADNLWRYLDGSGHMAVNSWVDGTYYVDENGIMVEDRWIRLPGDYQGDQDYYWYYFSSSGKVVADAWKKINDKWYHFDDTGVMETGWVDENMYFCGEDGAAKTGWQKLYPPEGEEEEYDGFDEDDGQRWYYFSASGKKYVPSDDAEYGERRIGDTYYCFSETGIMQTGWVYVGNDSPETGSMSDFRFYGSDGKVRTGWYSAEPPKDRGGYEDEVEWFYFSKSGVPKASSQSDRLIATDIMTINKKRYLFNENGVPVYGLQKVYDSAGSDTYTAYYFGDSKDRCSAQDGRIKIEEGDGTPTEFYFSESGKGFTGIRNGSLYYMGKLQKASDGLKYEVISMPSGNGHTNYLVNSSGKIVKSTSGVKDSDGVKYVTNSSGVVQKINDESISSNETFTEPYEPVWY
ncbi:MAG: cell wall-binding protein [Hungatella sp.]